jgi:protein-S-isoprenylcysteine O-methyltransferase Ste14
MTLTPSFEIGVWNAWIPMLVSLIPVFFIPLITKSREKGVNFTAAFNKKQKNAHVCVHVIYLLLAIYSIFLPLKLETLWFYVGLPICLVGLIMYMFGFVNIAMTPPDKVVTTGTYRYTRHPMYLTSLLVFIGIGIASASWIFLLLSIVYMIMPPLFVGAEERFCIEHYGDGYREYMRRTPRWIGIPKSGSNKQP